MLKKLLILLLIIGCNKSKDAETNVKALNIDQIQTINQTVIDVSEQLKSTLNAPGFRTPELEFMSKEEVGNMVKGLAEKVKMQNPGIKEITNANSSLSLIAFYHNQKIYCVTDGPLADLPIPTLPIIAHELVHAYQDQLIEGQLEANKHNIDNMDQMIAYNAIIEGQAQYYGRQISEAMGSPFWLGDQYTNTNFSLENMGPADTPIKVMDKLGYFYTHLTYGLGEQIVKALDETLTAESLDPKRFDSFEQLYQKALLKQDLQKTDINLPGETNQWVADSYGMLFITTYNQPNDHLFKEVLANLSYIASYAHIENGNKFLEICNTNFLKGLEENPIDIELTSIWDLINKMPQILKGTEEKIREKIAEENVSGEDFLLQAEIDIQVERQKQIDEDSTPKSILYVAKLKFNNPETTNKVIPRIKELIGTARSQNGDFWQQTFNNLVQVSEKDREGKAILSIQIMNMNIIIEVEEEVKVILTIKYSEEEALAEIDKL